MGIFSGAHADNSGTQLARANAAQNAQLQGAADAYSNYRVANAQARQRAMENMMSLYSGPNDVLAGISGGRGADLSRVGYSPFGAASGYFNIGRAAPGPYGGMSIDSRGTGTLGGDGDNARGQFQGAQFNGGQIDMRQNGLQQGNPFAAPQQVQAPQQPQLSGNPFAARR